MRIARVILSAGDPLWPCVIDKSVRIGEIDVDGECYRKYLASCKQRHARFDLCTAGTKLTELFASLGIKPDKDCQCKWIAMEMNRGGNDWCRKHRAMLLAKLEGGQAQYGWGTRATAAMNAVKLGYAIHPPFMRDPLAWLLDEAIRLSEQDQSEKPSHE